MNSLVWSYAAQMPEGTFSSYIPPEPDETKKRDLMEGESLLSSLAYHRSLVEELGGFPNVSLGEDLYFAERAETSHNKEVEL